MPPIAVGTRMIDQIAGGAVTLVGDRIVLREPTYADWPAIHRLMTPNRIYRYLDHTPPATPSATQTLVARWIRQARATPRTTYTWVIVRRDTGHMVGLRSLALHGVTLQGARRRVGELSVALHPGSWGRGYSTESAQLVVGFAFGHLDLDAMFARVHPDNIAAQRAIARAGLRRIGQRDWLIEHPRRGLLGAPGFAGLAPGLVELAATVVGMTGLLGDSTPVRSGR